MKKEEIKAPAKPKTTAAPKTPAAAAPQTAEKKFELREGDVQLFHNTQAKNASEHELWGRAILLGGQTKFFRLWKAEAKSGR